MGKRITTWEDLKYTFTALVGRPGEEFTEPFQTCLQFWEGEIHGQAAGKFAANALLGFFGKREHFSWTLHATNVSNDVSFAGCKYTSKTPGSDPYYDILTKTALLKLRSWRPIQQIALEAERPQMARALHFLQRFCKPERIIALHVDGIFVQPGEREIPKFKSLSES